MFLHRILGFYHNKWNYRCLGIVPCNGTGHNRIIVCWAEMEMCQKSQLSRRTTNECLVLLFLQITTEFHRCFRSPGCCLFLSLPNNVAKEFVCCFIMHEKPPIWSCAFFYCTHDIIYMSFHSKNSHIYIMLLDCF